MTRKTKILFAMGCMVAVALAGTFLVQQFQGEVRVAFAGTSSNGPQAVYFSVTNSFRNPVVYYLDEQVEVNGVWPSPKVRFSGNKFVPSSSNFRYSHYTGQIMGRATETIEVKWDARQRWRVFVMYRDSWSTSWLGRTQAKLAAQASRLGWNSLSQRLKPNSRFLPVFSPIMLGNQPVEPELK